MLKKVISGAMLMAMVMGFASCSDDDNDARFLLREGEQSTYEGKLDGSMSMTVYPVDLCSLIDGTLREEIKIVETDMQNNPKAWFMNFSSQVQTTKNSPMKVKVSRETDSTITLDFTQLLRSAALRMNVNANCSLSSSKGSIWDVIAGELPIETFLKNLHLLPFATKALAYFDEKFDYNRDFALTLPLLSLGKVTLPIEMSSDGVHFYKQLANVENSSMLNTVKELVGLVFIVNHYVKTKTVTESLTRDKKTPEIMQAIFSDMTINCIGNYEGCIEGEHLSLNMGLECDINSVGNLTFDFQIEGDETFVEETAVEE